MTGDTTGLCRDHSFETAEDVCRRCAAEYCELCLVYPFGASKPLCKECAIAAGGVRAHVTRPAMPKKDVRRKVRAFEERRKSRGQGSIGPNGTSMHDAILTDPLAPTDEDLERVSAPAPAPPEDDGATFAEDLSAAFGEPVPTPAAPRPEEPADGVAPPIDWSQPFG